MRKSSLKARRSSAPGKSRPATGAPNNIVFLFLGPKVLGEMRALARVASPRGDGARLPFDEPDREAA